MYTKQKVHTWGSATSTAPCAVVVRYRSLCCALAPVRWLAPLLHDKPSFECQLTLIHRRVRTRLCGSCCLIFLQCSHTIKLLFVSYGVLMPFFWSLLLLFLIQFVPLTTQDILRDALSPSPVALTERPAGGDEEYRRQVRSRSIILSHVRMPLACRGGVANGL